MLIYKITNKINGKIYIGLTSKKDITNYWGSGKIIMKSIKKYGIHNFTKEILEFCDSQEKLNEREIHWIDKLKKDGYSLYNISNGGNGGNLGEEVNKLISDAVKGEKHRLFGKQNLSRKGKGAWNKGKKNVYSDETINKMKKPKTEEHRKALSVSHSGKIISEEHKKSLSIAFSGEKNPSCKKIEVETIFGEKINFEFISQFLNEHKISWYLFRNLEKGKIVKIFKSVKYLK